ncbi:MAG: hypothetical protein EPN74_01920 [Rhodanobacter sp.]|nr:MAG: hypothetical protein EPN74_01920 [Rhodanobacter sp.]
MQALLAWQSESASDGFIFHAVSDDLFLPITEPVDYDERQAWTERRERAKETELRKMSAPEVAAIFRRASRFAGIDLNLAWPLRVGRDSYKNRQLPR